ncbi:MAG: membrane protein insertase YidC [Candidatus Cloacimonadaceae bacterium]|nr:membrane protein insertase YidC [Candidatus Cloacimonadaceae bacterium]
MDKRTLTALLLMLILFLVFQQFIWKKPPAAAAPQSSQLADTIAATQKADSLEIAVPVVLDSLLAIGAGEKTLTLSNDLMTVSFSNIGGAVTAVHMKKFFYQNSQEVNLIPENGRLAGTKIFQSGVQKDLGKIPFLYREVPDSNAVEFYLGDAANPLIVKRYRIDGKYGILLDVLVQSHDPVSGIALDFSDGIADSEKNTKSKPQEYKFCLNANNEIKKTSLAKLKKAPLGESVSSFSWAATRSKYFNISVLDNSNLIRNYEAFVNTRTGNPAMRLDSRQRDSSNTWEQSFVIYAGPNDFEILLSYGKQMEDITERGISWLRWLSSIIAWFLKFLHSYIPNYGIVIVIFSIVLKIVLHPLTHKSMDANLKMQHIQPQVQAIQSQYKSDPRVMQVELSKLYKETGASPFSGCLPLLLQMPIFFSLYSVLRNTLDMRNAHFVGWLKDLSEPDPYLVLPIIMGIFMILQSLMMKPPAGNIAQMDDKQKAAQQSQKMMTWLMPIMMFFIFKGMPAGLVLYWTVFNILTVIQQYYLQKHFKQKDSK